jgi:hypothetical protein
MSSGKEGPEISVDIAVRSGGQPSQLYVDVGVRNDTGREASAPKGARAPRLRRLSSREGTEVGPEVDGYYRLPGGQGEYWTLAIERLDAAALDLRLEARVGEEGGVTDGPS